MNKPNGALLRRANAPIYVALLVASVLGALAYTMRVDGIFACPPADQASDQFVADCNAKGFGDYDHGAFWFGLEREALNSATEAQVLFLGSSRMQLAFSTDATRRWFASGISYYLLGFSHSENVRFAGPLLEKIRPKAKVYVINVDRFFVDSQTAPAEELFRGGDVESRYREKRFWQLAQGPLCKAIPSLCGQAPTFIRSRPNGSWKFKGTAPFQAQPVTYGADATLTAGDEYERLARTFVTKLRVAPSCVLLTIAPYPGTKLAEITSIADSLGLALIVPRLEGLRTFDGSHLDGPSAERWSNAFFEGAGPQIKRCLE